MGLCFFLPADDGGPGGPAFRIQEARHGYLGAMLPRLERRLQLLHEGWRRAMTPPSAIALCRDFAGARPRRLVARTLESPRAAHIASCSAAVGRTRSRRQNHFLRKQIKEGSDSMSRDSKKQDRSKTAAMAIHKGGYCEDNVKPPFEAYYYVSTWRRRRSASGPSRKQGLGREREPMAKKSLRSQALAFILSQAFWVLPGVQPASAQFLSQCYLPPFTPLVSPCVPHDTPAGPSATISDLAVFAWQEFIALNWVAMDPATTGVRGQPNQNVGIPGFLGVGPDSQGNFPLVVWQTYRHKNELFPADGHTDPTFDSSMPTYKYANPVPAAGSVVLPVAGQTPSFHLFNNLDETSEIGLCNMYAHATSYLNPETGIRVGYEVKVNRALFDYANTSKGFTTPGPNNSYAALFTALATTRNNLSQYGGICTPPSGNPSIVMLPCGDFNVPPTTDAPDPGEGAIEIKAAWRRLTAPEAQSGRFFTQSVVFYTGSKGSQVYNNAVWGLVALHIIHKTISFPAFVFATFEQVDDYNDNALPPMNSENLAYENLSPPPANQPVTRARPIPLLIESTNNSFHTQFTAGNPNTIWQYYKLTGVQATPVNGPPAANAPTDDLSYYYLANIVVETNQALQNFTGDGFGDAFQNVFLKGTSYQMGGCQGCHGFSGQMEGGDMSVIIARGPANTSLAESLDASTATSAVTYKQRLKGVSEGVGAPGRRVPWWR
jgi:hypothetical protein